VKFSRVLVALAALTLALAGCKSTNNLINGTTGSSGLARMVVASGSTTDSNLTLLADNGTINSGLSVGTPVGVYSKVSAGSITFTINDGSGGGNLVPGIDVDVNASTNYSIALEGEPGQGDYIAFGFQDTNPAPSVTTVRYKVNNAAPNLATPVDFYIWPAGTAIPGSPQVTGLPLNEDTGSMTDAPGNSYIPMTGSATVLAAGQYDVAIVLTGTVPNGTTDLFDAETPALAVNTSYSFTIEDENGTQNNIGVVLAIDEPLQSTNQSARRIQLTNLSRKRV
jgi:hypothetical protein